MKTIFSLSSSSVSRKNQRSKIKHVDVHKVIHVKTTWARRWDIVKYERGSPCHSPDCSTNLSRFCPSIRMELCSRFWTFHQANCTLPKIFSSFHVGFNFFDLYDLFCNLHLYYGWFFYSYWKPIIKPER